MGNKRVAHDEHGKVCTACQQYKPWDGFSRYSAHWSGRASQCLVCERGRNNANYHANIGAHRQRGSDFYYRVGKAKRQKAAEKRRKEIGQGNGPTKDRSSSAWQSDAKTGGPEQ